ncbi:hypothetical protein HID58_081707, partial [Brassica napus]
RHFRSQPSFPTVRPTVPMIGGTGSMTPPSDHELPQSPAKSYSQAVAPGSRDLEERFSNVVRYSPMADLQGGVALAANAQQSSSKDSEEKVRNSVSRVHDSVSNKVSVGLVIPENEEPWLTIPQSSPSGCRNNGKSARSTEVELPSTSSPSRFHLLSTDLEEGEVEMENESPSSDEESSVESKAAFEKKKQMEKQKLGKNNAQCITVWVTSDIGEQFLCSCVYASNFAVDRQHLWTEMAYIKTQYALPGVSWIVMDDFNETL